MFCWCMFCEWSTKNNNMTDRWKHGGGVFKVILLQDSIYGVKFSSQRVQQILKLTHQGSMPLWRRDVLEVFLPIHLSCSYKYCEINDTHNSVNLFNTRCLLDLFFFLGMVMFLFPEKCLYVLASAHRSQKTSVWKTGCIFVLKNYNYIKTKHGNNNRNNNRTWLTWPVVNKCCA